MHLAGDSGPFFGQDFQYLFPPMADANESKKETVRIDLAPPPQPPVAKPPDSNTKSRETVRIQLPVRQPSDKAPLRTPTGPSPASKPPDQGLPSPQFFQSSPPSSVSPPKPPTVSMPVLPPAPVSVTAVQTDTIPPTKSLAALCDGPGVLRLSGSPYEMGLSRLVHLEKGRFIGQRALTGESKVGHARQIVGLEIEWTAVERLYEKVGLPPSVGATASRVAVPVYKEG